MRIRHALSLSLALLVAPGAAFAAKQAWDPIKQATGWASFDRDGSCVFFTGASRKLLTWSRDSGVTDEVDLGKVRGAVEKWALDSSGNAWVVTGTTLQWVGKDGKLGPSHSLPAEVADLAWDSRSLLLAYRTQDAYLERREMKSGALMWSFGPKPGKGATISQVRHHVAVKEDGQVLLNSGNSFNLEVLDLAKGTRVSTLAFKTNGQPAPTLNPGDGDRGAMAWWLNRNTALVAVPQSQLPAGGKGLVLGKLDLNTLELTLIPTGADENATLVGILEESAVLQAPTGGLTFFPIP